MLQRYTQDLSNKHRVYSKLSKEQEKPFLNIQNTVICYGIEKTPPNILQWNVRSKRCISRAEWVNGIL